MKKSSPIVVALLLSNQVEAIPLSQTRTPGVSELVQSQAQAANSNNYSCFGGIERFTNGPSNSFTAFRNSQTASAKWRDPGFPADDSSLWWQGMGREQHPYTPPVGLHWKRPEEMGGRSTGPYGQNPKIWGNLGQPVPNGVDQGELGDTWFLSAASSISEDPERITRIIWNDEYNDKGAFRFYFWIKNGWYGVNVDDRLPSEAKGAYFRPWATRPSTQGAWWMPLLEKAFAKLDQNYDRIIAGWGQEALRTLTGMPVVNIALDPEKQS